ncbi:MAG: hypothetical protein OXC66_14400 [Roseovarius sp.]|nr:hypothetical protein [Roseovarius sp.]
MAPSLMASITSSAPLRPGTPKGPAAGPVRKETTATLIESAASEGDARTETPVKTLNANILSPFFKVFLRIALSPTNWLALLKPYSLKFYNASNIIFDICKKIEKTVSFCLNYLLLSSHLLDKMKI